MIDLPEGALDSANLHCECRALKHRDSPCRSRGPYETVMRPVSVTFMFWTWHGYKRLRVCDWCSFPGDVRVEEGSW